jgi:hypothetical protein
MKIKDYKCKCEHNDFFFADKGNQTGIYCSYCGKWLKWADKDEQNLRMKQEPTLDKIRAEIVQLRKHNDYIDEQGVTIMEVFQIIDKYKAEREE